MLAPAIGLFVLAVAPWIILEWRLVVACAAAIGATIVVLFLELPIRAAMHAPLVYAHPDTWSGFWYVVLGQQFGGVPPTVFSDLGGKYALVMSLLASWLGPLGYLATLGVGTSLVRRPRFVLLTMVGAGVTCAFAASYANADIERYFLVPAFVAFTYVGLGLADAAEILVLLAGDLAPRFARRAPAPAVQPAGGESGAEPGTEPSSEAGLPGGAVGRPTPLWQAPALLAIEAGVAIALLASSLSIVPQRQISALAGATYGAVSQAGENGQQAWLRSVFAPPDQGGLPANSVIVSTWSASTTFWYGQKVEGLRPDVYVVDDSIRVEAGDNLGEVWDVIDSYLGRRPVFAVRFSWGYDGMDALSQIYDMADYRLANGFTITQVISKKGAQ